jgi:hypothetical protein
MSPYISGRWKMVFDVYPIVGANASSKIIIKLSTLDIQ